MLAKTLPTKTAWSSWRMSPIDCASWEYESWCMWTKMRKGMNHDSVSGENVVQRQQEMLWGRQWMGKGTYRRERHAWILYRMRQHNIAEQWGAILTWPYPLHPWNVDQAILTHVKLATCTHKIHVKRRLTGTFASRSPFKDIQPVDIASLPSFLHFAR